MIERNGYITPGDLTRGSRMRYETTKMFPSIETALHEIRQTLNQGTAPEKRYLVLKIMEQAGEAFDDVILSFLRDNLEVMAYGDEQEAFLPNDELRWPKSEKRIIGKKAEPPKKRRKKRKT